MSRCDWENLPAQVRSLVEHASGMIVKAESASAGINSDFAATLYRPDGQVFCKGVKADSPRARMHRHEAAINPWLPRAVAPRLLWEIEADGWLLLGFEHIAGRHPDLSPASPDLPLIADAASTLAVDLTPCPPVPLRGLAEQWAHIAAWRRIKRDFIDALDPWSADNLDALIAWETRAVEQVDGDTVAHTDLHRLNILIGDAAHAIDWAWSRRAAAWVDAGFLVIRLIDAGHSLEQAERWAEAIPPWATATEEARTAFAVAILGIWEHLALTNSRAALPSLPSARIWARARL